MIRSQTSLRSESHAFMKWRSEQEAYYRDQWGAWFRPQVSEAEAREEAVRMAGRFRRMYVRTRRQMRDHRRYSPVVIANAGQVNIAADGGKRVNVKK